MKVKVCKCEQCKAAKKSHRPALKRRIRRYLNRKRRERNSDDRVLNWYWA